MQPWVLCMVVNPPDGASLYSHRPSRQPARNCKSAHAHTCKARVRPQQSQRSMHADTCKAQAKPQHTLQTLTPLPPPLQALSPPPQALPPTPELPLELVPEIPPPLECPESPAKAPQAAAQGSAGAPTVAPPYLSLAPAEPPEPLPAASAAPPSVHHPQTLRSVLLQMLPTPPCRSAWAAPRTEMWVQWRVPSTTAPRTGLRAVLRVAPRAAAVAWGARVPGSEAPSL
mmetsp:Transcript_24339/g.62050  ORF Transcript_24339/g.62050 Transcript_24339/m.62050 type:complete len:228 (-) Transcript_24339:1663-2346(-)